MKEEEVFFVKVKDPNDVKKNLLESLKDIVENLHRFEKFKAIREEKLENINKLRENIKELTKLNSKLRSALPETKLRIALKKAKEVKKKRHKVSKKVFKKEPVEKIEKAPKAEKQRPLSELEKLETELSAIEGRLGNLK
jgi:hypothetical protein|tara:strand:- start:2428 stop:2844 length:417 start_codon:yes stop_codon:yes gene_type:complete